MLVKIKKLNENAILPTRMTPGSAGFDLYSCNNGFASIIPNGGVTLVSTGIALQLPEGYEAQLRPRSGLAMNECITILNAPATIDSDYRGEIKVLLINHGHRTFYIEDGMRIAQLVISKYEIANFEIVTELDNTERNVDGFGSTGTK